MSDLLVTNHEPDASGLVHDITPESAGWSRVGFSVYRLKSGQTMEQATGEKEACVVIIGGKANITAGSERFENLGERDNPFEGKPWSVYVPWHSSYQVEALSDVEIAVATAPGADGFPPRLIHPDTVKFTTRGKDTNTRHVYDILPETEPANALLVVEVITPSGSWSSYPSHKHDTDNFPNETALEETYYHKFNPPQGFGFQRVYTDDRSLDETMCLHDGDVVMVPRGYHPVGTAHGYDLYYLNVMAGPKRVWKVNTEQCHRWLLPQ